ncbi:hypothetical protein [Nitratireductor luteus]|uniref:hypothetical protein n=1 Tax=Nitratireductor luteus TaxID=2976980 RepID=UPI00223F1621|nr:hypothetical protein [Nitratireductor luteus]
MEGLSGFFGPILSNGLRYAIQKAIKKDIRFGPEISAYDLRTHNFRNRRVYRVYVRVLLKGDYNIKLIEAVDGSGDGIVFFPPKTFTYDPPIVGWYSGPDIADPRDGSISFNEIDSDNSSFTIFLATTRQIDTAWVDIRYTILNERQSNKRALLRIPLEENTAGF